MRGDVEPRASKSLAGFGTLRVVLMLVYSLGWSELDPAGRSFDPAVARAVASARILAADAGRGKHGREALAEAIDRDLLAAYGPWVAGWQWAASEPGGGGPVRGWCCATHSMLPAREADPKTSVERVVRIRTGELDDSAV